MAQQQQQPQETQEAQETQEIQDQEMQHEPQHPQDLQILQEEKMNLHEGNLLGLSGFLFLLRTTQYRVIPNWN